MDQFRKAGEMSVDSQDPDELVRLTIESYNRGAEAFRDHFYPQHKPSPNRLVMFALVTFVRQLIKQVAAARVLDVGCGPGEHVGFIARSMRSSAVIGVDRSDGMLRLARDRFPDIRLARMDVRRLAFPDESFDGIWSSNVVHHLPPLQLSQFFAELWRVARRRCSVYIITHEGSSARVLRSTEDDAFHIGPRYVASHKSDELRRHVESAGFHVVHTATPGDDCVHLMANKA